MTKVRFVAFKGLSLASKAIQFFTRSMGYSHIAFLGPTGMNGKDLEFDYKNDCPVNLTGKEKLIECWPYKGNRWQEWSVSCMSNHTAGTPYEVWELPCTER